MSNRPASPVRALKAELRAAGAGLADNDDLLRGVLEGSGDCIKILDLDGRLQFMSGGRQAGYASRGLREAQRLSLARLLGWIRKCRRTGSGRDRESRWDRPGSGGQQIQPKEIRG